MGHAQESAIVKHATPKRLQFFAEATGVEPPPPKGQLRVWWMENASILQPSCYRRITMEVGANQYVLGCSNKAYFHTINAMLC